MFNAHTIKKDFPILSRILHGDKPLVYLDSAATSQKPQAVLDAMMEYYTQHTANVHRGIHVLGDESTKLFYGSRDRIATFFGAQPDELILMRNTTEALNAIVYMWCVAHIHSGDVIVTTQMEHHSNFVPWQEFAKRVGAQMRYIEVTKDGELDMADASSKIDNQVKLVAVGHVSNATGAINPIDRIAELAHKVGAKVVVDGAQSAPHLPISFDKMPCDFYAFSGHKMLAPMGIGGLLVKHDLLSELEPYLFGGGMINTVGVEGTTFGEVPDKFIAGTPDVASTVGLAAACDYLSTLGMDNVLAYDTELVAYALEKLQTIPQISLIGPLDAKKRCGSVAFVYNGVHAHDVAQILDSEGVAVRSGHHCTMPLHQTLGVTATTRASFNVYTTKEDIDVLVSALAKVRTVFGK